MVPTMVGGIFWEHLHRLVAGGLILMWLLTGWLARRERAPARIRRGWLAGMVLLLVQAVFGELRCCFPPAGCLHGPFDHSRSSSSGRRSRSRSKPPSPHRHGQPVPRPPKCAAPLGHRCFWSRARAVHVGGAGPPPRRRSGLPRLSLCLGQVVPPLGQPLVALNFLHRVTALVTGIVVIAASLTVLRSPARGLVRRLAGGTIWILLFQVALGVTSVVAQLAVVPVSLHTLGAAALFVATVALAACGRLPAPAEIA